MLENCLNSIIQQTYQNLRNYLEFNRIRYLPNTTRLQDPRVKVYHKPNGGVGSDRNRAFRSGDGDYILFVDNDDWLELDHIESLYHLLKKADADIAIGNFTQLWKKGNFLIHVGGNDSIKTSSILLLSGSKTSI